MRLPCAFPFVAYIKMKIIVFGHQGWIGEQIIAVLKAQEFEVITPMERADDVDAINALLTKESPDRVLSCLGRTRGPGCDTIDFLEDVPKSHEKLKLNMRDNLFAPITLALACKTRGIHFTYLGTGCIFTYTDIEKTDEKFTETSNPNFFGSGYSVVKGYTDRLMRQLEDTVLQVRIRMPLVPVPTSPNVPASPYNFITKITKYAKICSVENSMTVLPTLLPIMVDMIKQGTLGTINLTNPGTISHNRILTLYKEMVDPTFTWTNFTVEEQNEVLLSQRSNNFLCTARLESLYPDVPHIEDAVKSCLDGKVAE